MRSSEEDMEQLSLLFNEAEVYADQTAKEDDSSVAVAAHKRHRKHEYTLDELPENVPVEVVEHRLPEEELVCPECGSTMTEIGKEVRRRLKLVPAKAVVVENWYYTYACRKCEKENTETTMVKADREPNFIPGSFATPEAAAHFMVIDRKNFLFANTPSGAKSSAVIFSLIQTAIENGLDPYRYLTWLLSSAPEMELAQPDVVRSLLPWNAPVSCKP